MKIKKGKVYKVKHDRKGKFTVKINEISTDWVDCLIVDGKATGLNPDNDKYIDDEISLKKSMCVFSVVKSGE